jgi:hypothetical protein
MAGFAVQRTDGNHGTGACAILAGFKAAGLRVISSFHALDGMMHREAGKAVI